MKERIETSIKNMFSVDSIIGIYNIDFNNYLPQSSDASIYDFWQMLFAADGSYDFFIGEARLSLSKGQMAICKPNMLRKCISYNNLTMGIISFRTTGDVPENTVNKAITLNEEGLKLIKQILLFGKNNMRAVDETDSFGQKLCESASVYEFQKIKNSLEMLILDVSPPVGKPLQSHYTRLFMQVDSFLKENITKSFTLKQISEKTLISPATIKRVFAHETHGGVINHFILLKINTAKELLAKDDMNITQIADFLGFSSVHYFSRLFKKQTGHSPLNFKKNITT